MTKSFAEMKEEIGPKSKKHYPDSWDSYDIGNYFNNIDIGFRNLRKKLKKENDNVTRRDERRIREVPKRK